MYIYIIQKINNNIQSLGIILKLGGKKERICINLLITCNTYIPFTRSYQFWTHCAQFTRYSELACLKAAFDSQLYEQFDIADQIDLFSLLNLHSASELRTSLKCVKLCIRTNSSSSDNLVPRVTFGPQPNCVKQTNTTRANHTHVRQITLKFRINFF